MGRGMGDENGDEDKEKDGNEDRDKDGMSGGGRGNEPGIRTWMEIAMG